MGFEVPDEFVVGYGLDYAQQYRNMPSIGVLEAGGIQQVKRRILYTHRIENGGRRQMRDKGGKRLAGGAPDGAAIAEQAAAGGAPAERAGGGGCGTTGAIWSSRRR